MSCPDFSQMMGYDPIPPARRISARSRREILRWERIATKALLCVVFACLLLPMYFMVTGSFQTTRGLMAMPPRAIPLNPTFGNYALILKYSKAIWLANTATVAAVMTCLSVLVSCSAGYAFAFYKFPGKRVLWSVLLLGIVLPYISLVVPRYVVVKELHLSGTLIATILPGLFAPGFMYIARTYFQTVPISLLESARLEGAAEWTVLTRIVMPVSRPVVAALSVLTALGPMTDFLWQMLVLQKAERQTLLIGFIIAAMKRGGGDLSVNPLGKGLAAGCLLVLPLLLVFILGNRYFTGAIGGAVKE